jgi:hypothetical protein
VRSFGIHKTHLLFTLCSAALLAIPANGLSSSQDKTARPTISARSTPKASVNFTNFNFGDVYTGEIISQIFVIKNDGNAELVIGDVKSDCGCTVARADKAIPAGHEGTAEVEVQTISQSGLISRSAILQTNDPLRPTIVLTVNANVLKGTPRRQGKFIGPIFLAPDSRLAMFTFAGKKATAEFTITADGAAVNVLSAEAANKQFVARIDTVQPGKSYKIIVESKEIDAGGLYRDQLRVTTDNPNLPSFNVELALRVYSKE